MKKTLHDYIKSNNNSIKKTFYTISFFLITVYVFSISEVIKLILFPNPVDWYFNLIVIAAASAFTTLIIYYIVQALQGNNERLVNIILGRDKHIDDIKRENSQLEKKLLARDEELKSTNRILLREIERTHALGRELQKAGSKYKLVMESLSDSIILIQNGRLIYSNRQFADNLGYTLPQLRDIDINRFFTDSAYQTESERAALEAEGKLLPNKYELTFKRKDDTEIHFEARCRTIKLSGSPATFMVLKNISDNIKINEELNKTVQRNNAVLEAIPDIMFIIDDRGHFLDFNYHNLDELALPPDKIIGSGINDLGFNDTDKEYILKHIKEALETGEKRTIEYKLKLSIGLRYFEARIVPFNKDKVLSIVRDITKQKQSDLALKTSEERYRLLFKRSPVGIFHYDDDLVITEFNDKFVEILQSSREKLLALNLRMLNDQRLNAALESPIKGKNGYYEGEYLTTTSHIKLNILLRTAPYYTRTGQIKGGIGILEDIGDRKSTEKALIRAKELAERSNQLKSEFLAQMSHEIRTPVNSILSFSSLIKEEVENRVDKDLQSCFGILDNAGKRIIRTIDLLLNMSEIQTNSYLYRPVKFDIYRDVLMGLYIEFRNMAKEKNLEFEIKVNSEDTEIVADKFSITQIFVNLIDNAIKYTKQGKVQVKIYRDLSNSLNIAVIDTGIGIEEEYLPYIFEPFTQEEQGYTRRFEGNGLGLSLVKKYCDLNNTKIKVQSIKDKGTTFNLTFREIYSKAKVTPATKVGITKDQ